MSMREYGVQEYGLVLTKEEALNFAKRYIELDCPEIKDIDECEDWEIIDYYEFNTISSFSGEATKLNADGFSDCNDFIEYDDETVYYLSAIYYPNLFYKAYNDYNELLNEFKTDYSKYLPKDFKYEEHIRIITGSYWG